MQRSPRRPRTSLSFIGFVGAFVALLVITALDAPTAVEGQGTPAAWTQVLPPTNPPQMSPPSRANAAMTYDGARGNVVLFGGFGCSDTGSYVPGAYCGDTWTWDGTTWTQRTPVPSPSPRAWMDMTYDPIRRVVVLFGGYYQGTLYDDTWTWDGTTWTRQSPMSSPTKRAHAVQAFDAARGVVVLFGGWDGNSLRETWTWDGSTWTRRATDGPRGAHSPSMVYDAARGEILLFGGTDNRYDPNYNETWTWNGTSWSQRYPTTRPPGRTEAGTTYHADQGVVLLFGGYTPGGPLIRYGDTWTWDGTNWTAQPGAGPPARGETVLAYDAARKVSLLFGGNVSTGGSSANWANDTWIWGRTNRAPSVGPISTPLDPKPVGTTINVSASFTDPDPADTHTAVWEWGDGTTSPGVVNPSTKVVTGGHTYAAAGVYTLKLTVTDSAQAFGQATYEFVVIYDPNGGFVTGAGQIDSPLGACRLTLACQGVTGRAKFGFQAKYQSNVMVPSGNTKFEFKDGNFEFESTSYEWLIVAGARAQFKGTGVVTGQLGTYQFLLTAIDGARPGGGGADKFRIKITGPGGVVYDNQLNAPDSADPTTLLTTGNIIIHTN